MNITSRAAAVLTAALTSTLAVATLTPAAQAVTGDTVVTVTDRSGDVANPGKVSAAAAGTVDLSKVTFRVAADKTKLQVGYAINGSDVIVKNRRVYGFEAADSHGNVVGVWGQLNTSKVVVTTDGTAATRTPCQGASVTGVSEDLVRLTLPTKCLADAGVRSGTLTAGAFIESIQTGADLAYDTAKKTGVITLAN